MHIDTPTILSSVAAIVGLIATVWFSIAYGKLSHKHDALKAELQQLLTNAADRQHEQLQKPIPEDKSKKIPERELRKILDEFNARKIADSETLKRAFPLLKDIVTDAQRTWLTQEMQGYEATQGFLEQLPAHLRTYRLVYADQLKMSVNGVIRADLRWPPAANKLIFLSIPLAEIERKIADTSTDLFAAAAGEQPDGIQPGVEAVGLFHKCQLQRITGRFRQEFSNLLCDVLGL